MNLNEYRFDSYLSAKRNVFDAQPNITTINENLYKCGKTPNIIYYGPDGIGKYSCALDYISRFSGSGLSYEKRMIVETTKGEFAVKISDVHFEIDMSLLGCNAKQTWNDIVRHIHDVMSLRKGQKSFLLCKNFQDIHGELLDVFYSYMQTTNRASRMAYVILTNCVSFIPSDVMNRCLTIHVARPARQACIAFNKGGKMAEAHRISNLRQWKDGNTGSQLDSIVKDAVDMVRSVPEVGFDFLALRDRMYDINVLGHNPWAVVWGILNALLVGGDIPDSKSACVVDEMYRFLELFNNNYRPIYHLERCVYFLATIVNELQGCDEHTWAS